MSELTRPFCGTNTLPYDLKHFLMKKGYNKDHAERQHAIFMENVKWTNGSTIKVSFWDDDAPEWKKAWVEFNVKTKIQPHVNLYFNFLNTHNNTSDKTGDIRVTFKGHAAKTSIGTGNTMNRDEPSCHLGWVDAPNGEWTYKNKTYNISVKEQQNGTKGATVVHEFCHAIGMLHEHQSPNKNYEWKCDYAIDYFAQKPNEWTPAITCGNVLNSYGKDPTCPQCTTTPLIGNIKASNYDPDSIMMYAIPKDISGAYPTGINANHKLSPNDIAWLAKEYPGKKHSEDGGKEIEDDDSGGEDNNNSEGNSSAKHKALTYILYMFIIVMIVYLLI